MDQQQENENQPQYRIDNNMIKGFFDYSIKSFKLQQPQSEDLINQQQEIQKQKKESEYEDLINDPETKKELELLQWFHQTHSKTQAFKI